MASSPQPWHTPWRQDMTLSWPAEVRFHGAFPRILEDLRERGLLRAFRVDDKVVGARLPDQHEMNLRAARLQLSRTGGPVERKIAEEVIGSVLAHMKPAVGRWRSHAAHLYPVDFDGAFDELCADSSRRLLGDNVDQLKLRDYALLMDGNLPFEGLEYQAEFGIIRKSDVLHRLVAWGDRVGAARAPTDHGELSELSQRSPDLSIFVELTLTNVGAVPQDDTLEWTLGLQAQAQDGARWLTRTIATVAVGEERLSKDGSEEGDES